MRNYVLLVMFLLFALFFVEGVRADSSYIFSGTIYSSSAELQPLIHLAGDIEDEQTGSAKCHCESGIEVMFCQQLTQKNTCYILQNDIFTDTTCFQLQADNITLDMNGFTIYGDDDRDYGINMNGHILPEIKNGKFQGFVDDAIYYSCNNVRESSYYLDFYENKSLLKSYNFYAFGIEEISFFYFFAKMPINTNKLVIRNNSTVLKEYTQTFIVANQPQIAGITDESKNLKISKSNNAKISKLENVKRFFSIFRILKIANFSFIYYLGAIH